MPDRLASMMAPIAQMHARKMASAFEAICAHACMESAMTGALIARGMAPGAAQMTVDQWPALGLLIPANVYAPAHIAEAVLTGQAVPTAQQVASSQPGLIGALAITPGYEQLLAQPGVMGKQPGMMGKPGMVSQPAPFWGPTPGMVGTQQSQHNQ